MKNAAIYARVSSVQQKEENTIASQTEALVEFARQRNFVVPDEFVIEDNGFSGSTLMRPGLERVRDLVAEGRVEAVIVYSPDRLSRKYAYQVLLTDEFSRHGVETVFVKAPHSGTPEDNLLVQFQGMIAEYERAQIMERCRRGKRHRAKSGEISVMGSAPYGYKYIHRSHDEAARYEIFEDEAAVVRLIFEKYTDDRLSIGAVVNLLNERHIPTRWKAPRWERTTVWSILRNPAYKGTAVFGKTQKTPRKITSRASRLSGRSAPGGTQTHHRDPSKWIEIPVPGLVSDEVFALASERLAENKRLSLRRTQKPSVVQGLLSCRKCGYAMYRSSQLYYRCFGSDKTRHCNGAVCDTRPVRMELIDKIVWDEVFRLLQDPCLIEEELKRRLEKARSAEPTKQRRDSLEHELVRVTKSMGNLLTAFQEELVSLEELRKRMPDLRARERSIKTEIQAIDGQASERESTLRLTETITSFLSKMRKKADTLDVMQRQKIVRLLVKEVMLDDTSVLIRHSIPTRSGSPSPDMKSDKNDTDQEDVSGQPATGSLNYPLCTWRYVRIVV